jgi:uncharacterized glyoxalase superfamily protein PhnB
MRRLKAAGANEPKQSASHDIEARVRALGASVRRLEPMMQVPNVREAVEWYQAIGFKLEGEHEIDTAAAWAGMSLGGAYIMFGPWGTKNAQREVSFWFMTDRIDDLYQTLKQRQLERASAVLAGRDPKIPEARFTSDIHDTFYGQREFSIVDLNGYELNFAQEPKP